MDIELIKTRLSTIHLNIDGWSDEKIIGRYNLLLENFNGNWDEYIASTNVEIPKGYKEFSI